MFEEILKELLACPHDKLIKAVFSAGKGAVQRAEIKPILLKDKPVWQCEIIRDNKAFHKNLTREALGPWAQALLTEEGFRQVNLIFAEVSIAYRISKKGKVFRSSAASPENRSADLRHNREKRYIFAEGMPIHPLVDLGVFDSSFRIIKAKRDKFKQINRFIEIIDDAFRGYRGDSLAALDFGCGKSYLTFLVYYYFTYIRKLSVTITGYDLKEDVVASCNRIAEKYGYSGLRFVAGDICKAAVPAGAVDMILTLHACDTATDYALYFAAKHKIRRIFSVPCCQHELNAQIKSDTALSLLLKHGLYKERFSALLTDCIRCEVLTRLGYDVDVVEFVDFTSTPKNAMIRGVLTTRKPMDPRSEALCALLKDFHATQTLVELCSREPLW